MYLFYTNIKSNYAQIMVPQYIIITHFLCNVFLIAYYQLTASQVVIQILSKSQTFVNRESEHFSINHCTFIYSKGDGDYTSLIHHDI